MEKLFGKKTGIKVSATFDLQQMWMNEGGPEDNRPDAPGWFEISPVFSQGKMLSR